MVKAFVQNGDSLPKGFTDPIYDSTHKQLVVSYKGKKQNYLGKSVREVPQLSKRLKASALALAKMIFTLDWSVQNRKNIKVLWTGKESVDLYSSSTTLHRMALANFGDVRSMIDLALMYKNQGKTDEALNWLQKAADKDHPEALFLIKQILAETKGDVRSMIDLALMYKSQGKTDEVLNWLQKAADKGHPEALFLTKQILAETKGDVQSMVDLALIYEKQGKTDEALNWLQKAADKDHPEALFLTQQILAETKGDVQSMVDLALIYKKQGKLTKP